MDDVTKLNKTSDEKCAKLASRNAAINDHNNLFVFDTKTIVYKKNLIKLK